MRALISAIATPRRRLSRIRLGHSSDSTSSSSCGRQWSRKRAPGGRPVERRELVAGARRQALGHQPRRGHRAGGDQRLERRARGRASASSRGSTASASPTLGAMQPEQRARPAAAALGRPRRSARRAGSSLARRARRCSASSNSGPPSRVASDRARACSLDPSPGWPGRGSIGAGSIGAGSTGGQAERAVGLARSARSAAARAGAGRPRDRRRARARAARRTPARRARTAARARTGPSCRAGAGSRPRR